MGIMYLLLSWSMSKSNWLDGVFIITMLYLPGVIFPLLTTIPIRESDNKLKWRILHILLSVLIFYGSVWIFSGHVHLQLKYISILAGFIGSVVYLITTWILYNYLFSNAEISIIGLLSGLAFLSFELFGGLPLVGLAVSLWIIFNGYLLNLKHKTTAANIV